MANKRLYQFLYSKHPMLSMISGQISIGAAGAVSSVAAAGVQGVTLLTTGIYKVKLQDNWPSILDFQASLQAGTPGANVADGSFVVGTLYQITAVGTTNWAAVGLDADFTAAVGMTFVATAVGGVGTGTAKAVVASNVLAMQMAQSQSAMLTNPLASQGKGSVFHLLMLDAAGALVAPSNGSIVNFEILLKNSTVASL